jgi:hypothetical protein
MPARKAAVMAVNFRIRMFNSPVFVDQVFLPPIDGDPRPGRE